MLDYIRQEANQTMTENGAVTYRTTGSDCLDLFATIGALQKESNAEILSRFIRAYSEDADLAMKLLFFARDIRGGLGERRVFRVIFSWLAKNKPESVKKNIPYVAEYGRYDDLLVLFRTDCEEEMLAYLKAQFETDLADLEAGGEISLLAKWLPSVNASNRQTVRMAKRVSAAFGMRPAEYRKALTKLRARLQIIENYLREKDYSFDYEKQPSRALFKYRQAFWRNDGERYGDFIARVTSGSAKLHADHVAPYEMVQPYLTKLELEDLGPEEKATLNATWASLPDFGGTEDAIAVIDTSGSMYGSYYEGGAIPAAVALSLGLYFAERNKGAFRNHFIEFSDEPQLIEIKGETFVDRLRYLCTFSRVANTNLEAMFDLVLAAAIRGNVPQEELPARLIIISDMEFDSCVDDASEVNFKNAQRKYEAAGYKLPGIVFWNVASRNEQQPVTMNESGVMLVSGATPRLFSMVAGGGMETPYEFMLEVLTGERYSRIRA